MPLGLKYRRLSLVFALLLSAVAALPAWRMGLLRDDWLLLWHAVDPAAAPDAAGVFSRPLAMLLWRGIGAVSALPILELHVVQMLLGLSLFAGLWRLPLPVDRPAARPIFVLIIMLHVSLLELRVWGAASNGLLALSLGVWAVSMAARSRPLSAILFCAAALARVDALLLLLWLPALSKPERSSGRLLWLLALPALALIWTVLEAGMTPSFELADAGRSLRLIVLPWGVPLSRGIAALVGALGCSFLGVMLWRHREKGWVPWASILAVVVANAVLPWAAAGRYSSVAVVGVAAIIAARVDSAPLGLRGILLLWLGFHLWSDVGGNTVRDLKQRSLAETELYRALQDTGLTGQAPGPICLQDPPPMGWTNSQADAENVASYALRRATSVRFLAFEAECQIGLRYDVVTQQWTVSP